MRTKPTANHKKELIADNYANNCKRERTKYVVKAAKNK